MSTRMRFTGKERDAETGLDYFGARYFSGAQERFPSADPITGTAMHVINPQRWNMYAYALNNPLFYTDPDGRHAIAVILKQQGVIAGIQVMGSQQPFVAIPNVFMWQLGLFADATYEKPKPVKPKKQKEKVESAIHWLLP